jgi:putative lipoic acid-binding regulatory protein
MEQEKYNQLRDQLIESTQWPSLYMFKFIIPNKDEKLEAVKAIFPKGTQFAFKTSKDMGFLSITVKIKMKDADAVITIYEQTKHIEGLFAL